MPTLTFTPSLDGLVGRYFSTGSGEVFSTIRNGAGNASTTTQKQITTTLTANSVQDRWTTIFRLILLFDTASIPDAVVIASATLKLYILTAYDGNPSDGVPIDGNFNIFSADPASDDALVNADYGTLGTTAFATAIDPDDMTEGAWTTFTLNSAGLAAISKTGLTKLGIREAVFDAGDTTPSWTSRDACAFSFYGRLQAGYEPILTVTYTTIDPMSRVSSIRHIFRPGFFRMQAGLGDLGFDVDVAETAVRRELDTARDSFKERMETTAKQLQEEAGMSREESLRIARKLETLEDIAREPIGPIPTVKPPAPPPRFPGYEAQIEYEVWFEQQLKELREMGWEG